MIDQETLSKMILDGEFDALTHGDDYQPESDTNESSDSLTHYGILGMKWGVRRTPEQLGHARVKRRDRRYEGESDKDYQNRMARESAERKAKIEAKTRAQSEKRAIREREASQRRTLRSQEKIAAMQLKAQRKREMEQTKANQNRNDVDKKTKSNLKKGDRSQNLKNMTDQEVRDAIARMRLEREYLDMAKKPDGFLKSTVKGIKSFGGGILVNTGKSILTKKLAQIGGEKLDSALKKYSNKKSNQKDKSKSDSSKKSNRDDDDGNILYLPGTDINGNKVGYDMDDMFEVSNKKKKKKS